MKQYLKKYWWNIAAIVVDTIAIGVLWSAINFDSVGIGELFILLWLLVLMVFVVINILIVMFSAQDVIQSNRRKLREEESMHKRAAGGMYD